MNAPNKLKTPEAAAHLGLSPSTLEKYRLTGEGPVYFKSGPKIVLYSVEDLDAWLNARRRTSTSQRPTQAPQAA
jgi:predicted DNA-binding transcriptional regulator AlpA